MSLIPFSTLEQWSKDCATGKDTFVHGLPKVELHVHIEGTLSAELRWKLARRNNLPVSSASAGIEFTSLEQLKDAYLPRVNCQLHDHGATGPIITFFDMFDEGLQVLRMEEDFYNLAMDFFGRCVAENVRYVEPFFGPHSHRHRGIAVETFMNAYRRAQRDAETKLGVVCQWIMVINRGKSPDEAWENYRSVALEYKDLVVGIGVAGNEVGRPPSMFEDLLRQARSDGFKITVHCDLDMPNTHEHIEQVLTTVAGTGADRCDHGLNIAEKVELIALVKEKNVGMTLCPWGYATYHSDHALWSNLRKLHEEGIKVTINSDDPPYMMGQYTEGNLMIVKIAGGCSNADLVQFQRNAIEISWAPAELKAWMLEELEAYEQGSAGIMSSS